MTLEEKIAELPWLAWCKCGHYFFAGAVAANVKCPTCGLEMSGASKMDERTPAAFAECTCDEDDVKHWPGCDVAVTAYLISRARQAEALEGENRRLREALDAVSATAERCKQNDCSDAVDHIQTELRMILSTTEGGSK